MVAVYGPQFTHAFKQTVGDDIGMEIRSTRARVEASQPTKSAITMFNWLFLIDLFCSFLHITTGEHGSRVLDPVALAAQRRMRLEQERLLKVLKEEEA